MESAPQRSILVAEEEPAIRSLLESALTGAGLQVWTAANPAEAVELYRQHRPDLVLAELAFAGKDSVALVRSLRNLDPEARCCLMTASSTVYTVAELQLMGVLDVFVKPFDDPVGLAETLRQMAGG